MADVNLTLGLDDREFQRGLDKSGRILDRTTGRMRRNWYRQVAAMESRSERFARQSKKHMETIGRASAVAMTGLTAAMGVATRAVDRYNEKFPGAASGAQSLKRAIDDLYISLGRDLSGDGFLTQAVKGIDQARTTLTNFWGDVFAMSPGHSAKIDEQRKAQEAMIIEGRQAAKTRMEQMKIQQRIAEASGNRVGAARIGADIALEERKASLRDMAASGEITGQQQAELLDLARREIDTRLRSQLQQIGEQVERESRAASRKTASDNLEADLVREQFKAGRLRDSGDLAGAARKEAEIRRERRLAEIRGGDSERKSTLIAIAQSEFDVEIRRIQAEEEARRDLVKTREREIQTMIKGLQIENMRRQGNEREADLAATRLDFEERRRQIQQDELLTAEQKATLVRSLSEQERQSLALVGAGDAAERTARRSVAAGTNVTSSTFGQIFSSQGRDRELQVAREGLTESRKHTQLLEQLVTIGESGPNGAVLN